MSYLFVALLALSVIAPLAHSAVTPGAKCTKAGMKQTYKGKVHTCIALGSKLYWNNGEKVLGASATDSKSPTGKKDARKQCRADQEIELVQQEATGNKYWHLSAKQIKRYTPVSIDAAMDEYEHKQRIAAEENRAFEYFSSYATE